MHSLKYPARNWLDRHIWHKKKMNLTTCALFFRLFPVWPFFIWEAKIIIYILYSYNHHYFYSKYSHEKIVVRVRRNTFLSRIIHDIQSIKWGLHSPQLVRSSSKFWNTFMPYVHRVHYRCVRSSSITIKWRKETSKYFSLSRSFVHLCFSQFWLVCAQKSLLSGVSIHRVCVRSRSKLPYMVSLTSQIFKNRVQKSSLMSSNALFWTQNFSNFQKRFLSANQSESSVYTGKSIFKILSY